SAPPRARPHTTSLAKHVRSPEGATVWEGDPRRVHPARGRAGDGPPSSSLLASLDPQELELAMQVRALDAQHLGGPRDVPVVLAQALEDERPLDRLTKGLERELGLLPQQPTEALVVERQLAVGLL